MYGAVTQDTPENGSWKHLLCVHDWISTDDYIKLCEDILCNSGDSRLVQEARSIMRCGGQASAGSKGTTMAEVRGRSPRKWESGVSTQTLTSLYYLIANVIPNFARIF